MKKYLVGVIAVGLLVVAPVYAETDQSSSMWSALKSFLGIDISNDSDQPAQVISSPSVANVQLS